MSMNARRCVNLGCNAPALVDSSYCGEHSHRGDHASTNRVPPRPGHQDRLYATRISRLRDRLAKIRRIDGGPLQPVLAGMLDVLADLIADQEEVGK